MGLKPTKCSCRVCRRSCELKPCWLTPEEARVIDERYPGMTVVDSMKAGRGDLHYTDHKPLEGRLASHELSREQTTTLRVRIGQEWER